MTVLDSCRQVWGTGGREFKSRRSDHKINDLAQTIGQLSSLYPQAYHRRSLLRPATPDALALFASQALPSCKARGKALFLCPFRPYRTASRPASRPLLSYQILDLASLPPP